MESTQKKVLIVGGSPLFKEFIKEKLAAENVITENTTLSEDPFTKIVRFLPDLIIIDVENSFSDLMTLLEEKIEDINARRIPVIISGPVLERAQISGLVKYGVIKYFTKPIKFAVFFEAIGKNLRINLSMDTTPCLLEIHHNGNIIFIEIAQALNREKIALLKYKLTEMIDSNRIREPKIIVMMTNLELSFVDGINVEFLLDTITSDERIINRNVNILSLNDFMKQLIDGHSEYDGIRVIEDLTSALGSLVEGGMGGYDAREVIANSILAGDDIDALEPADIDMTTQNSDSMDSDINTEGSVLNIAVVDDDEIVRKILSETFTTIGATTEVFDSGEKFIQAIQKKDYDFAIIDILMSSFSGFDILNTLHARAKPIPTIVYSQAAQREFVIQALSLGAKSYLTKPQKPAVILKKVMEVLHEQI